VGVDRADAIGGLIVAAAAGVAAVRVGMRSVDVLMDRAPGRPYDDIEAAAGRAPGVAETRRVRVRGDARRLFADVTVAAGRTASLERAHDIAEAVEQEISRAVPGVDVVVHVEPISETSSYVERAQAAASRAEGVHEVHNVVVHSFDDSEGRKLHVTLHAKVDRGLSIQQAHDLSDRIEAIVRSELGDQVRVDSHLEPLETTSFGRDVTSARPDVVDAVRMIALSEPNVVDCHEVVVTQASGELSIVAHLRSRADLPLQRIHDSSQRIEKAIHSRLPEVGPVLIHFEPA
jgi:divalent metal cation (Fe/Co/Zn/Cd) transporter